MISGKILPKHGTACILQGRNNTDMKKANNHRHAAGLEWRILKKMPKLALAATLIPLMISAIARLIPMDGEISSISKQLTSVDIFSIAIAVTAWTALFTLAIGCVLVVIVKGPRYIADSYELNDSDRPGSNNKKS